MRTSVNVGGQCLKGSTADVRLTRDIVEIAKPFNIAVHDHLVIGRHGHASLKGLKMI